METLDLYQLYEKMFLEMGPQGWWPADSKVEIIIGAILVQNTNWNNVKKSLANLKDVTSFQPNQILSLDADRLMELIRPSGFYKNKSRAIMEVFEWLNDHCFDFERMKQKYGPNLRKQLLALHGIGEETVDVLLLYVFDEPVFIADKYAQKLFSALGQPGLTNYRNLKNQIHSFDAFTLAEAQEFHGLIDEFGKVYLKRAEDFSKSFLDGYKLKLS